MLPSFWSSPDYCINFRDKALDTLVTKTPNQLRGCRRLGNDPENNKSNGQILATAVPVNVKYHFTFPVSPVVSIGRCNTLFEPTLR